MIWCPHCGKESSREDWNNRTHSLEEIVADFGRRDILEDLRRKENSFFRCPKCGWVSSIKKLSEVIVDDSKYFFLEYGGG